MTERESHAKGKTDNHVGFPSLLRSALQKLDEKDSDKGSQKNGVGFNREDGDVARELVGKEEWDGEDVKTAFQIAKHYKNTQLKEQWKEISESGKEYLKQLKEQKKLQRPEGLWSPVKQKDGYDIVFLGWKDKMPYKRTMVETADNVVPIDEKVVLKEDNGEPIQDLIKRFVGEDKREFIEFKGEVFTKPEFVNLMVYPSHVNNFTECLNALPIEEGEYREPKFYIQNNHISFPVRYYARRNDSYQKILKDAMKIGSINLELYREGIGLLRKYPKQITLFYSVIGANIVNVLDINDYPITIDAIGNRDTGKSFSIVMALKWAYGIGEAILQDDAINSAFRHHATADSTNLVIYIEEAKIGAEGMSKLKSRALNIRGNTDKSMTVYGTNATWVLSRNSKDNLMKLTREEREAQNKRIYEYYFSEDDVVRKEDQSIGKEYMLKIKNEPGGVLFNKLEEKPITEIRKKYFELMKENDDNRKTIALLGSWLMDDPEFVPVLSDLRKPSVIDDFYSFIHGLYGRRIYLSCSGNDNITDPLDRKMKTELDIDPETMEFMLTVRGFNLLKKEIDELRNFNATEFAKFCNLELTKDGNLPLKWMKTKERVLTGIIPKEIWDDKN
ncbi:hypothetical protein ACNF40_07065 [Cuniculiplasma sp. SKW4]|uniref:hypothetical protein n=1 Tax=Cuniculiplasma sp. SKW4 TaxID=3400171 RepID=UPI003FD46EED